MRTAPSPQPAHHAADRPADRGADHPAAAGQDRSTPPARSPLSRARRLAGAVLAGTLLLAPAACSAVNDAASTVRDGVDQARDTAGEIGAAVDDLRAAVDEARSRADEVRRQADALRAQVPRLSDLDPATRTDLADTVTQAQSAAQDAADALAGTDPDALAHAREQVDAAREALEGLQGATGGLPDAGALDDLSGQLASLGDALRDASGS